MFFDTHTHLDQPEFDEDRAAVIDRARTVGVETMLAVGTTASTSEKCLQLAQQFGGIYAAVGLQPNYLAQVESGDWDRVVRLAASPQVVALGETGLDRHWDFTPFELQREYFDRHLHLSRETGLPVIVHMRDCEVQITKMLREARLQGILHGVMHSFTGSAETAAECIEMGLYISFSGMVTFKKSDSLRAVAATIPPDRILVETDSPYLSPRPVRHKRRNEPSHLSHTAACLADVCGKDLAEFGVQTRTNAWNLFGGRKWQGAPDTHFVV